MLTIVKPCICSYSPTVYRTTALLLFCLMLWGSGKGYASEAEHTATGPHITVSLISEHRQLQAGINWLGILLEPDSHWHTYWRNPGDSGEAPHIDWVLPDGVQAGEIQWPIPQPIQVAHLVNYGYNAKSLLMVPVTVSVQAAKQQQTIAIAAKVSWLVCKEDCIPGWATLGARYPVSALPELGPHAALFAQTRKQQPSVTTLKGRHEVTDSHLVLSLELPASDHWHVFPFDNALIAHASAQEKIRDGSQTTFLLNKGDYFTESVDDLHFLVSHGEAGFYVRSTLNSGAAKASTSVLLVLVMALLGGLSLNLMPCVLPVLSIKALSISHDNSSRLKQWAYGLGVLLSFNLFAVLIVSLKQSGEAVGWGFHMQEPWVIALLAYLFVFIALLLLDLVPSTGRLSGVGQSLIQGNSFSSQFFTGVLAVIVASPCTAPFMAAALGVAMVSDALTTFLIFNALGIGFALPFTLIFMIPALRRWLPKPGAWMESFRQFLVFPMFATVIWLLWVYLQQTSALSQLFLLSGLLVFCLLFWLASKFTGKLSGFWLGLALVSMVLPIYSLEKTSSEKTIHSNGRTVFTQAKLSELKNANQVVLVNMTADWCITCKVNEQIAFQSESLNALLAQKETHYLVGDWTNKNDEILRYLNQYQRSGVPLYVVYSGNHSYQILPQILTAEIVIKALKKALAETKNETSSS